VKAALEGNLAMAKARLIPRDLVGDIQLKPEGDGSLWAEYETHPQCDCGPHVRVVGVTGFEPATYTSRT
jgi:hypothetical protein